jgi:hypothetical protein
VKVTFTGMPAAHDKDHGTMGLATWAAFSGSDRDGCDGRRDHLTADEVSP